jgi:hypothetical protein
MAALLHPYLEVSGYYGEATALQRTAVDVAQRLDNPSWVRRSCDWPDRCRSGDAASRWRRSGRWPLDGDRGQAGTASAPGHGGGARPAGPQRSAAPSCTVR